LLAGVITKYVLEESLPSMTGVIKALLLGGNVFGAMMMKKNW